MADNVMQAFSGTHQFRPQCLRAEIDRDLDEHGDVDRGFLIHALVGVLHDIDHGTCPRCEGPLATLGGDGPVGSRVTSCRCIPICARCGEHETLAASVGGSYSVFDWHNDRAVREDIAGDLEDVRARGRTLIDLSSLEHRLPPVA